MTPITAEIRVASIRSRGKHGGAIFSGTTDDEQRYVVVCNRQQVPDGSLVDKGQRWRVTGTPVAREVTINGYVLQEQQIEATEAELLRPAGRNIIDWIASSEAVPGVGRVKAAKLWDRFGPALATLIENRDAETLSAVISEESAALLCEAFDKQKVIHALLWLDQAGVPRKIGAGVVTFYGADTQVKVTANPYCLVSFEAEWKTVDRLARERFGVGEEDPRRLESAIEEVLNKGLNAGHTCLPLSDVKNGLIRLLGKPSLVAQALERDGSQRYVRVADRYQAAGSYIIESYVADRLRDLAAGHDGEGQESLFGRLSADPDIVDEVLSDYEEEQGITLSEAQRAAVLTSSQASLSLILGGAGTGKTTVLKAVYEVIDALQPGAAIYQLALAGRAAQRMAEATGRPSMTIAGFLTKVDPAQIDLGSVVVVDEMSMVDVILMYRLLRHIPAGVRLILVGDPAQLPPIGPGLVLHALVGLPEIPQVELQVVQRQTAESGIPAVAAAIRAHRAPSWAPYEGKAAPGVSFVPCAPERLDQAVQEVYRALDGDGRDYSMQILSTTLAGAGGVKGINAAQHENFQVCAEPVTHFDPEFGAVAAATLERVPVCVGDLVMYTENNYELGLRNGSLGIIVSVCPVETETDVCCHALFDGVDYALTSRDVRALTHAYAITVHKSQGSQFRRVIVPIRSSRLLDQALIYTAVTRGVDQVVLVGDEPAALAAIAAPASATRRYVSLPLLLAKDRV